MHSRFLRNLRRQSLLACALGVAAVATSPGLAERPRIYAITHATIVTAPGTSIDDGTVVVRDGLIEAVGTRISIPPDAVELDASGRYVYAGLIDADSSLGRTGAAGGGGGRGTAASPGGESSAPRSGAVHPLSRIHPEARVRDDLLPFDDDDRRQELARIRDLGFTAVLVTPPAGLLRGRSTAILLAKDRTVAEIILAAEVAQHASFAREPGGGGGGGYPVSLMGMAAATRQALLDATRYATWTARYLADPVGLSHPPMHAAYEALLPLLDKRQALFFSAAEPDDALLADRLAREFDLRLVIGGSGYEWEIADEIAAAGRTLILPVGFPDKPKVDEDDDALAVELRDLRRYTGAAAGPGLLHAAGVRFALSLNSLKSSADFTRNMTKIVDAGLPADTALAALTTVPAELLGLSRSLGTIERGKIANLLITDGPLFRKDTKVRQVFVAGIPHEVEVKEKPKGDPDAVVDPRGEWSVLIDLGERTVERVWTIEGDKDNYRGSAETGSGTVAFESIELAGNALTVVLPGRRGSQEITVIVAGDSFEGTVEMGSRTGKVTGSRTSGPDGGGA